jgi:nitrile hydratase
MGGRPEFFGTIDVEADEPVFHEPWERRVFGLSLFVGAALGPPNVDAARLAMEQLTPEVYHASYYHRWLGGLELKLIRDGFLAERELDAKVEGREAASATRRGARARRAVATRLLRPMMRPTLPRWLNAHVLPRMFGNARPTIRRPRFAVGDRVRVRAEQAAGHTRQPGYVTGRPGIITARQAPALLADAHAVGRREPAQHLYTVEFAGRDLWGDAAEPHTEVRIDLFESYLEPR